MSGGDLEKNLESTLQSEATSLLSEANNNGASSKSTKSIARNNYGAKTGKYSSEAYSDDDNEEDSNSSRDVENPLRQKGTKESSRRKGRPKILHPRRSLCHSIFVIIQIIALLSNLSMLATQLIPLFVCQLSIVDTVIRCYLATFAFFFFLIEIEIPCISSPTLQNWISRGFLYTFFGVVQMEQGLAMVSDGSFSKAPPLSQVFTFNIQWTLLFIQISSWLIVGIGVIYFFLGIACLQNLLLNARIEYQQTKRRR